VTAASDEALPVGEPEGDDETPLTLDFTLQHDLAKRLDRYLVDRAPTLSRTQIQRLIDESAVSVNGRIAKASTKLRKGDHVIAVLPPPPSEHIPPDEIPLEALFEDEHLIVVNKQAGLIVHPARSHKRGTLVNALAWRFRHVSGGSLSGVGKEFARPGVVHRLDKWTTGVMVAAKGDTWPGSSRSAPCPSATWRWSTGVPSPTPTAWTCRWGSTPPSARCTRSAGTRPASPARRSIGCGSATKASRSWNWNCSRDAPTRSGCT
jgi:hypothetical protein